MVVSVFDLFKIGIGLFSSHTVGPVCTVLMSASGLEADGLVPQTASVHIELYDSLGIAGRGHDTDHDVILSLMGETPGTIDPDTIDTRLAALRTLQSLSPLGRHAVRLTEKERIAFCRHEAMIERPNDMEFRVFDAAGGWLREARYLSVGGDFVVIVGAPNTQVLIAHDQLPHPFRSGRKLLTICESTGKSTARLIPENELTWHSEAEVHTGLLNIRHVMQTCATRGRRTEGELPGPFHVRRCVAELYSRLMVQAERTLSDPLLVIDWVNPYTTTVNEENAVGRCVVTALINGVAGTISAVTHCYGRFMSGANDNGVVDFLFIAGVIGMLYKMNASTLGTEVGCQSEVDVACFMTVGALVVVLGGMPAQAENATEIGMEHSLGLTCDPVGGLVQVSCVEHDAMVSTKAVNAARIALRRDSTHYASLDSVIRTMRETGADVKVKYKETARRGLAVNITEC